MVSLVSADLHLHSRFAYIKHLLFPLNETFKRLLRAIALLLAAVMLSFLAGLVLCEIEGPQEKSDIKAYEEIREKLRAELSPSTYSELVDGGYFTDGELVQYWQIDDYRSRHRAFVFAFTLISTIGFGDVAPVTPEGKLLSVLVTLIGIPFVTVAYTYIGNRLLAAIEFVFHATQRANVAAFRKYDTDESGTLDEAEFMAALHDLGHVISVQDAKAAMQDVDSDQRSDTISYAEFCHIIRVLGAEGQAVQTRRIRAVSIGIILVTWIIFGGVVFVELEHWDWGDGLWFCWTTLTTIGLGDFVPEEPIGEDFLVLWAIVGLGIVAIFITAIVQYMTETVSFLAQVSQDSALDPREIQGLSSPREIQGLGNVPQESTQDSAADPKEIQGQGKAAQDSAADPMEIQELGNPPQELGSSPPDLSGKTIRI